uniref:Uncharacterized protein n=1 Tax=Fagus sylvatica TaxID=28930 RepID=A0A2N9HJS1_FAGSY
MIQRSLVASNTPKEEGPGHISQGLTKPIWEATFAQKILSGPLQLGPRAKTLRQEVHFSYHMQLSDHQELLRSSRNLSQKMTPWHKERSNGLRSQDHILRTQARLCARPSLPDSQQVDPQARVHWKEDTLMHDVELSDRQDFIGSSRNPDRKTALKRTKNTPGGLWSRNHISQVQARISANPEPCKSRQRKLSDAAFARRVFPARNKLIYEPGCVGKITTPATSWNSRFAESIPHLIGIFTGKVHENSSNAPTSGSHNSPHPNSDSCKLCTVGKRTSRAFRTICCMTHFEFQKTSKTALRKSGQKENTRARIEEDADSCLAGRRAREARHQLTQDRHARASWRAPRARPPINKALPPLICTQFLLGL